MDLSIYREFQNILGIELNERQIKAYPFVYNRALFRLEKLLGWSISQRNVYEEVGKLNNECAIINQSLKNDEMEKFIKSLKKPDDEEGVLRLFPYSSIDTNIFIDPAKAIYKIKLVVPVKGSDDRLITIKEFKNWMPKVKSNNYIQYISKCKDDIGINCGNCCSTCSGCGMLMIDGDWVRNVFPDDLAFILADLIAYEFKKRSSVIDLTDLSSLRTVHSESVSNHSVTYDTSKKVEDYDPLKNQDYIDVIKTWMGPYSPLRNKMRII